MEEQSLKKILDLIRLFSIVLLVFHFYYYLYNWVIGLELNNIIFDRATEALIRTDIYKTINHSKLFILLLLAISLIGSKGKKAEDISLKKELSLLVTGIVLFMASHVILWLNRRAVSPIFIPSAYILVTSVAYLMTLAAGTRLSRFIQLKLREDIFNSINESFPQEERLLANEYSINVPAQYIYRNQLRRSWINIINPFRGTTVLGTAGAGKTYFFIRRVIIQHISKNFSMLLYDFKYPDLTQIAYNALLQSENSIKAGERRRKIFVINLEKIMHRCNPLDPASMFDVTDASESSRTILLGLNREWIKRQGDFFVESAINFVTAIIWFLRKYDEGRYCTLPHVIELMQLNYKILFPLLRTEPEIEVLINPFESAYRHEAWEQLEGQIASAKIAMARLSSPTLYYVLSGNDFTLDLNNPDDPKIICMGNNPQKQQIFGAVLSLYISRVIKLVNKKNRLKSSLIFDEFPTIYFNNIDGLIATARSNKVATTLAVQDYSQLKKDYGREQAEVIMNVTGNIISGQVVGDTAKMLSERFGRIVQERQSISINRQDTSISKSTQLDSAIPASKIAALSSGQFVGMVADNPDEKIALKLFHAEFLNDHEAIRKEEAAYKDLPAVRDVTPQQIHDNYMKIREDIACIIDDRLPNNID